VKVRYVLRHIDQKGRENCVNEEIHTLDLLLIVVQIFKVSHVRSLRID